MWETLASRYKSEPFVQVEPLTDSSEAVNSPSIPKRTTTRIVFHFVSFPTHQATCCSWHGSTILAKARPAWQFSV